MDFKLLLFVFVFFSLEFQNTSANVSKEKHIDVYNQYTERGQKGEPGPEGLDGPKGLIGSRGSPGMTGRRGPIGIPGPKGTPGIPGESGYCPTSLPEETPPARGLNVEFGTKNSPGLVLCKDAPAGTKSGDYYLGPKNLPLKVYCNMTTLETCLRGAGIPPESNHLSKKGGYWYTETGINMKKILYNLTTPQILWLRGGSVSIRQTLKYNCLDSVPYFKNDPTSSLKLLTWYEIVIGPNTTSKSPHSYSIPSDTDHCRVGSTEWKSTIIEYKTNSVYRGPIIDLWIADIRNPDQKMSIENVEVCFK